MGFKDEVHYEDNPQPYREIFVMRYDGTDVEQLTDDQWEEGTPAWQLDVAALSAKAGAARGEMRGQATKKSESILADLRGSNLALPH